MHVGRYRTGVYALRLSSGDGYAVSWMTSRGKGHIKVRGGLEFGAVRLESRSIGPHHPPSYVLVWPKTCRLCIVLTLCINIDPQSPQLGRVLLCDQCQECVHRKVSGGPSRLPACSSAAHCLAPSSSNPLLLPAGTHHPRADGGLC